MLADPWKIPASFLAQFLSSPPDYKSNGRRVVSIEGLQNCRRNELGLRRTILLGQGEISERKAQQCATEPRKRQGPKKQRQKGNQETSGESIAHIRAAEFRWPLEEYTKI